MSRPLRVIVWGPGGLGSICIRETQLLDEFELVGVYAYSEAKNGVDAGTLIGIDPVGVKASTDAATVLALDADCVLYTARDLSTFHTDDEILSILGAGHSIVTALPYQNMSVTHSTAFIDKVEAACKDKGVVFYATGVAPDLIGERVVPNLTALVNKVNHLKVQEYWDVSYVDPLTLTVCGFGGTVEDARKSPVVEAISSNFVRQSILSWAEAANLDLERIDVTHDFGLADEDLASERFTVAKGTVDRLTARMIGYQQGSDTPCVTEEVNWVWSAGRPPAADAIQGWVITIEGRPSVSARIDMRADLATKERLLEPGNPATEASYTAVVATMLKGAVQVSRAEPGIFRPVLSPVRWRTDLLA